MKTRLKNPTYLAPCFYCNVDSTELKIFVIAVIGGLILFTLLSGVGLYMRGTFRNPEKLNDLPIKLEDER